MNSVPQPKADIADLKLRPRIGDVWDALGGGELRRGRGRAWWRNGGGYNVSIDAEKGLWHDFVADDGGDVIALVETVRGCDFREAVEWLADFAGLSLRNDNSDHRDHDTDWPSDLKWATYWKITAEMLAEWALEELPYWHPERRGLTDLLTTIRLGDAALVNE
jgi:hypothetical protein